MESTPSFFPTTEWTLVHLLRSEDVPRGDIALNRLCTAYHRPLYHYARASGMPPHDAEDAVQDFFVHVLGNDALKTLRKEKGRMRGWMIRSFNNKGIQRRQHQNARKRGGGIEHVTWDFVTAEQLYAQLYQPGQEPAHASDLAQAQELWLATLARLDADPKIQKRAAIYAALRPCIQHGWPKHGPTQNEVAASLGITANALRVRLNNVIAKARLTFGEIAKETLDPDIPEEDVDHLWQLTK